jgi:amino acid adenylation domain-containing protein
MSSAESLNSEEGIAIVGMALRFPGANDSDEFWSNLVNGVDSISHFSADELEPSVFESAEVRAGENYVRARGLIADVDKFDASFFRYTPKEAAGIDPQQRVFLEVAWAALENAGCNPATYPGSIGVWAGMDPATYLWENILPHRDMLVQSGLFPVVFNNDKDYLATRVSYKLDLRGPSISLQTACSTGLVVVHNAFHGLLSYQCDVALAGVSAISVPQKRGYVYQEGAIGSRDGRCRPFDADASGTVFSDGVGVVVLKRLVDAIADGDTVYAVIKGSALNNDGARKAGYTAPSVEGQAEAIAMAQALAGIEPETISYVEAHGTATPLGDPVEVAALTKAFRLGTDKTGFCAIGSVKGNIGHLDSAAGIAGLIKAALALHHKTIPASIHYKAPNRQIDFAKSPFVVNDALTDWTPPPGAPRRAGVSSFGIGGTNAHLILQEAPAMKPTRASRPEQVLVLSAKSADALGAAADRLARHLRAHPELPLHDVAHTLQEGRQVFSHRLAVVAATPAEAADALVDRASQRTIMGLGSGSDVPVAFMFPGQGSQYAGMAGDLYRTEPVYQAEFDAVAKAVRDRTGRDIGSHEEPAAHASSPFALIATELALARLLMAWGVKPSAMIGHGVGELAAACLAGVMTREDAVAILACVDGALSNSGATVLSVRKAASDLRPMLGSDLSIDAENAPDLTLISGSDAALDDLQQRLRADGVWCRRIERRRASAPLASDAAGDLPEVLARIRFAQPAFRWVSGLTGEWITPDEVRSAAYWTRLMRETVRFSSGANRLLQAEGLQLLEVGPGGVLNTLLRRQPGQASQRIGTTIGNVVGRDARSMLEAVARLWVKGVAIDWPALRLNEARRHVPLPTYPFERKRHWIDPPKLDAAPAIELAPMSPAETPPPRDTDDVRTRAFALLAATSGIPQGDISGSASFLELGLDSLLLTQLVGAIGRQFGVEITLPQLLSDYATPDKLARRLAEIATAAVRSEIDVPAKPLIVPRPRDRDIPLSSAQRRLWFMDRLEGPNATYVIPLAVRLRGTLDRAALELALGDVVLRHESLRTIYPDNGGTPRQTILASVSPAVTHSAVALNGLSAAMAAECRRGFNLDSEPPLRAHLFELGAGDHVLLLQVHHIAGDGFSLMALAKDLSAAYAARVKGLDPRLPPLAVQYADFAAYQAELLGAADAPGSLMSRQLAFWTETLKGLPEEITLPKDRPRPAVASYRGDRLAVNIDAALHKRLVETAAQMEGSVFMLLQAALATLLTRLGGGTDIPIGSPIAGRTDNSLTDLVGCFVNMLVLRTDTSGNPTFRDLVARVRTSNLGAYAHQELPFERLVEAVNPERSLARHPLFQVMLALLNTSRIDFRMPGLETALEPVNTGTAQYDLSYYFNERRGADGAALGIEGVLEFSTDLFDRQTAERMVNAFRFILSQAAANPDTPIFDLPMLAPQERQTLLETFNATAAPIPAGGIHALIERQAERTPDRTAVISGATRLTYAELERRANRIAHALRARGVERGGRVGVCLDRSADLPATLLGILKAGACYVPLDPAFPEERLVFMAENAELTAAVSTRALSDLVNVPRDRMLLLDADAAEIAGASSEPVPAGDRTAQDRDPAYILYTSGSTGKPKGVVVPHRAVVNFLDSMAREPGASADDILLAVTTLSFDIAVLEIYLPLTVGAAVVIASREEAADGEALCNLLETSGATVMQATPASWRMLIAAGWRNRRPFKALIGGEALPKDLADELIGRGVELWNMYGPTETTVWSTCALIRDTKAGITIGRPIANTRVFILDDHGGLCPIGVPGELCISGAGVSLGYWKRPENTAERFVADPFAGDGGTLYRTGDRARWRSDGTIEHMGRLDDQVKVRGFRIELGEIEAVLASHPQVRQSAVRLLQAGPDDVRILAYYVPASAGLVATSGLRKHMRNYLPDYMIPQMFQTIDEIPLTPNGKVDRRRLPAPVTAEIRTHTDEPLSDPVQIAIAKIWTDLIGPSRPLAASDRFFEMGGHSLLALQALRRMESATGVKLDLRTLFQETLEEIAARCRTAGTAPVAAAAPVAPASKPIFGFLRRLKENAREPRV